METEKLIILAAVSLLTSILSGVGGGGGGFIGTPLLIFLGLTPQQAVATGKVGALGVTLGSLKGLSVAKVHSWRMVVPLMFMAMIIGLIAPHVITNLDNQTYRKIIGVILICMIPVVLMKRVGVKETNVSEWQKVLGWFFLVITLLLQAILSTGMGSLVVLVLMGMLGMKALEANVTKRFSSLILNVIVTLGLLGTGLIIWKVAIVLFAVTTVGGYVGSKIAIKKGNQFVVYIFALLMLVASLELLFG